MGPVLLGPPAQSQQLNVGHCWGLLTIGVYYEAPYQLCLFNWLEVLILSSSPGVD